MFPYMLLIQFRDKVATFVLKKWIMVSTASENKENAKRNSYMRGDSASRQKTRQLVCLPADLYAAEELVVIISYNWTKFLWRIYIYV